MHPCEANADPTLNVPPKTNAQPTRPRVSLETFSPRVRNAKVGMCVSNSHVNCGLLLVQPLRGSVPPREFDLLGRLGPHERLNRVEFDGQRHQWGGVNFFLDL